MNHSCTRTQILILFFQAVGVCPKCSTHQRSKYNPVHPDFTVSLLGQPRRDNRKKKHPTSPQQQVFRLLVRSDKHIPSDQMARDPKSFQVTIPEAAWLICRIRKRGNAPEPSPPLDFCFDVRHHFNEGCCLRLRAILEASLSI